MPESAEEVYARVIGQVGEHGRLPMPASSQWEVFPYEGEMAPKVLQPPVEAEQPRSGEGDRPCWCETGEPASTIWRNERWIVASPDAPGGLPLILVLQPREHLDLSDLDDDRASELGRLTVRLHRIMAHLPNIGRVHVNKWGDGGAHLHVVLVARTARLPQVLGSMAIEWDDILPPGPVDVWRRDLAYVASRLATHDGEALV